MSVRACPLVRPRTDADNEWLRLHLVKMWGDTTVVSGGAAHDATELPALVAVVGEERAGFATYRLDGDECELVTLNALKPNSGIGSALLSGVVNEASARGCRRLWLVTTNDNLDALRFYQRRGLTLTALHRGAVDAARSLKASIPVVGEYGIPIRDELELELILH